MSDSFWPIGSRFKGAELISRIVDLQKNGKIGSPAFTKVVSACIEESGDIHFSNEEIEMLCEKTIESLDSDRDGNSHLKIWIDWLKAIPIF